MLDQIRLDHIGNIRPFLTRHRRFQTPQHIQTHPIWKRGFQAAVYFYHTKLYDLRARRNADLAQPRLRLLAQFKRIEIIWRIGSMNHQITLHFYGDLNPFLVPKRRDRDFDLTIDAGATVKDTIESVGVPHVEIGYILVNGDSRPFDYMLQAGDHVSVYPPFYDFTLNHHLSVYPANPPLAFVLDVHLGRLAAYLRMLGFDTHYSNFADDDYLAQVSADENRILLSRDIGLLKRKIVTYGYFVRATDPEQQLIEVIRRYNFWDDIRMFSRCTLCNGLVGQVESSTIADLVPPDTLQFYDTFYQCSNCQKVYWRGSHHQRIDQLVASLMAARHE